MTKFSGYFTESMKIKLMNIYSDSFRYNIFILHCPWGDCLYSPYILFKEMKNRQHCEKYYGQSLVGCETENMFLYERDTQMWFTDAFRLQTRKHTTSHSQRWMLHLSSPLIL